MTLLRAMRIEGELNTAVLQADNDTLRNVRIWDYTPLIEAYQQIQTIRAYYRFHDVDVDRYQFPDGLRQVALSVRELDVNRLGGAQTEDSRILFHRAIRERAQRIAPFLRMDNDPYPVPRDGCIVWIMDAYTNSRWRPYSQLLRIDPSRPDDVLNYIRNSVKVVVDAYDGAVRFYVADPEDPIGASLRKAFPSLFLALDEMPESLRSHLRYPLDLFTYQAIIYRGYHMMDPRVFYNREDLWEIPMIQREEGVSTPAAAFLGRPAQTGQPMKPYYIVMQLPDGDEAE